MIELVIAVAIVAILVSIALPGYLQYTQRVHRADAIRELLALVACQEQIRARHGRYNTEHCTATASRGGYRFSVSPDAASTFHFTYSAVPPASAGSNPCGTLSINEVGQQGISGDAALLLDCWSGR